MAGFSFNAISQALDETKGSGVSFESKARNWGTEAEASDLIAAINICAKLQYLNLEGNTLGVDAARGIGEALKKHPEFKEALFRDLFTGRLKTEIPQALQHLGRGMIAATAQLSVLDCSDNALGPNGMVGLVDLIKSPTCYSLQQLKLNNCGLGIGGGKMLAQALLDCHTASVKAGTPLQLKIFITGRNRLENEGAKALAGVFQAVGTLEEIAMPQNGIYHVGISALSEAFKDNPNMRVLNLNDNTIGPKGAEAIALALESMQKLENINFGDCLLKTAGAVHLGEALQDGHLALETLNLGFNEIGPNGGIAIASAMMNKDQLVSLCLNGNQFGEDAREQIKEILIETQRDQALDDMDEDDSDAEDEEEEYSGEEEQEEDGSDDDGEHVNDTNGNSTKNTTNGASFNDLNLSDSTFNDSSICYVGDIDRPNTVESFCNTPNPSEAMFNALEDNDKITAFQTYLKTISDKDYLSHLTFAALKCSAISLNNKEALKVAMALYKDCYDYSTTTNQVARINNFFLTQLGLLKNEDKQFKPSYDLKACRSAIRNAISTNALPTEAASTFNLFLEKIQ